MNRTPIMTARRAQVFLVDLALTAAGLALLALGGRAVWNENLGLAGTALTAGLVLLFSATIHRFESLKGLGIEAKTRELDRTIDRAEVTLAQVKKLTELAGANLVKIYSSIGRWDSAPGVTDAYHQSRRVKELLADIGSDEQTIRMALTPWARTAAYDLLQHRHQKIHQQVVAAQAKLAAVLNEAPAQEKPALEKRLKAISSYTLMDMRDIRNWQTSSFIPRLRRYVEGIPEELDPDVLAELQESINKDEVEFRSLDLDQDFADIHYWESLGIR